VSVVGPAPAGTLTYSPAAGTVLAAGSNALTVTAAATTDYNSATKSVALVVNQPTPTVTVSDAGGTYRGTAYPATATVNGGAGLENISPTLAYYAGTYTTLASVPTTDGTNSAPTHAGSYTVVATFPGSTDYISASALANFTIAKADPTITVTGYSVPYDGQAHTATGTAKGIVGEALSGLNLTGTTHTAAGICADTWTFTDATGNYSTKAGTVTDSITMPVADAGYILTASGVGVNATGSATVSLPGGLFVDSTSATAITASGAAQVEVGGNLQVAGGVSLSGSARTGTVGHAPPPGDPLAALPTPSLSGLTSRGAATVGGATATTFQPGIYTSITVSGNAHVTLAAGTYIILGGGLTVSGAGSVTGDSTGVFIFNAGSQYNGTTDGGTYGAITLGGSGYVNLKPASSGTYAGILIFQSRTNSKVLNISGAANLTTGTIYAPAAQLAIGGGGTLHDTLVVNSLYVSGAAGAFQLSDAASSAYAVSTNNELVDPILTVAVRDDTGAGLDPVEVADLTASMDYLNAALAQFGVNLSWAPDPATADVHIHFAPTTPEGGFTEGVLGFTTAANDVYFAAGWNLYTGQDPGGIAGGQYDFQTLATHELAHTLGLGESGDPNSVMYEYLAAGTVRRALTDSNLSLINTDADRFMKARTMSTADASNPGIGLPASPGSVGPAMFAVTSLAAIGIADSPAAMTVSRLQAGPPGQTSRGGEVLVGGLGDDLRLGAAGHDLLVGGFVAATAAPAGDPLSDGLRLDGASA